MHDHETGLVTRKGPLQRSGRDRAGTRPGPSAGAVQNSQLQNLQRSAGNDAVTLALQAASMQQPPAVQRSAVPDVLRSSGRPLEESVRTDMETRLGTDFSSVRVHTGSAAERSAAEIGARAFTSGEHVVIGSGGADRHTLAHELTHVIQQRSGPVSGADHGNGLSISDPSDPYERAAEANATRVMRATTSGDSPAEPSPSTRARSARTDTPAIQRDVGFEIEVGTRTMALSPAPGAGVVFDGRQFGSTTWTRAAEANDGQALPMMGRALTKGTRMMQGTDFTVEADSTAGGSDLEFVTTHFPETDLGRARLEDATRGILLLARRIEETQGGYVVPVDFAGLVGGLGPVTAIPDRPAPGPGRAGYPEARYFVAGSAATGEPQVTVGVPLDRLVALYNQIEADPVTRAVFTSQDNRNRVMRNALAGVDQALNWRASFAPHLPQPSAEFRSLLFLLAQYLIGGTSGSAPYYKSIAPMLARTDFAHQFTLLSPAEVTYYQANPEDFRNLALRSADLAHQGNDPVLREITSPVTVQFPELTRRRWLLGIPAGVDLLSQQGYLNRVNTALGQAQGFEAGRADEFESMGSLGSHVDQTAGGPGPVLELRRMSKGMSMDRWPALMLGVFDFVRAVNGGQNNARLRYTP